MPRYLLMDIALIALAGFLGVKLYFSVSNPLDISPMPLYQEATTAQNDMDAEGLQKTRVGPSDFEDIVEKDLFRPERRAPAAVIVPDTAPPQSPPPVLVGTVITENDAQAYLKSTAGNAVKAYRVDDSIEGFTIHDIQRDRVIFLKEGATVEVKLEGTGNVKEVNMPASHSQAPQTVPQRVPARIPPRPPLQSPQQPGGEILPVEEIREDEYKRAY